jgi:hypothetical protein
MSPEHLRRVDHLDFLRNTASLLRDRGMSQGQILQTLEQRNVDYGPNKLSRFELLEIVRNAMEAGDR